MIAREDKVGFPTEYKYTKDHEWINLNAEGNLAIVGITDFALEQLGDIVHLELPEVGDSFDAGASFGTIESTKTVSDLYMPVSGVVKAINEDVANDLDSLTAAPYTTSWLIKIEPANTDGELLSAQEYEDFTKEE